MSPAAAEPLEALAATIAVALHRTVADLPLDEARALVNATVRRGQLRALDRHFTAHPDALTSGSSDAPPGVLRLAATLADRGHHQVRVPRCPGCDRLRELRHRVENGRLCDDCYHARRAATCSRCGKHRHISSRTERRPPLRQLLPQARRAVWAVRTTAPRSATPPRRLRDLSGLLPGPDPPMQELRHPRPDLLPHRQRRPDLPVLLPPATTTLRWLWPHRADRAARQQRPARPVHPLRHPHPGTLHAVPSPASRTPESLPSSVSGLPRHRPHPRT